VVTLQKNLQVNKNRSTQTTNTAKCEHYDVWHGQRALAERDLHDQQFLDPVGQHQSVALQLVSIIRDAGLDPGVAILCPAPLRRKGARPLLFLSMRIKAKDIALKLLQQ
jgi:hypothetical protein